MYNVYRYYGAAFMFSLVEYRTAGGGGQIKEGVKISASVPWLQSELAASYQFKVPRVGALFMDLSAYCLFWL